MDFERDVRGYRLIDSEEPDTSEDSNDVDMNTHLAALIEAAVLRERDSDK